MCTLILGWRLRPLLLIQNFIITVIGFVIRYFSLSNYYTIFVRPKFIFLFNCIFFNLIVKNRYLEYTTDLL